MLQIVALSKFKYISNDPKITELFKIIISKLYKDEVFNGNSPECVINFTFPYEKNVTLVSF